MAQYGEARRLRPALTADSPRRVSSPIVASSLRWAMAARSDPLSPQHILARGAPAGSAATRSTMTPEPGSVDRPGVPAGPLRVPARCVTVQRQFDQRASRFAGASAIVREVGRRLFERLDYIRHDARVVVDLGCGAGEQRTALLGRFARATWLGIDLSRAMLALGRDDAPAIARRPQRERQPARDRRRASVPMRTNCRWPPAASTACFPT